MGLEESGASSSEKNVVSSLFSGVGLTRGSIDLSSLPRMN